MQGSITYENDSIYLEEIGPGHTSVRYKLREILFSKQTPFQLIEVVDTYDYGRMLVLDGCVNVCERDEANYHEMIAHIPALLHPQPESVLIIGGGDGGTVRELLKHEGIRRIDLVEIDAAVTECCKEFFPGVAAGFNDPRVHVFNEDGIAFAERSPSSEYSLVIIDSSDPVGPAEGLFTEAFYRSCHRILDDKGIVVAQSESPYVYPAILKQVYTLFGKMYAEVYPYRISVPTYPSGQIYIMIGLKDAAVTEDFEKSRVLNFFSNYGDTLKYITPDVVTDKYFLPGDVKGLLQK